MTSLLRRKLNGLILILTCLGCSFFLSSCGALPEGVGRAPLITVGPAPEFTPDELATWKDWASKSSENKALAGKIISRGAELTTAIKKYNSWARNHNHDVMKSVGFSDDEIDKLYPKTE